MTLLRFDKDLLMLDASLSLNPKAPVSCCLSEPARSTRLNFEFLCTITPDSYFLDSYVEGENGMAATALKIHRRLSNLSVP